jgi:hypothetical protein
MSSNPRIIGVVVLAFFVVGCAGAQRPAEQVPDTFYPGPIEEVWPKMEALLHDKGWDIEYREGYKAASGWRQTSEGQRMVPGGNQKMVLERLVAAGAALPDGRCVIRIARQSRVVKGIETGSVGRTTEKMALLEARIYNGEPAPEYHRVSQIEEGPTPPAWVKRETELEHELASRLAPVGAAR